MATATVETTPGIISIRYQQLELIGSGGMGSVFHAYDRLNQQHVALKRVSAPAEALWFNSRLEKPSTAGTNTSLRLALAYEFQTLASLRHPNIISVLDYGFDAEQVPYFTMELLEDAQNVREAGQGQPLDVQVRLLIQMLQALAYLHRRGVLHRDLKPANVLVTNDQERQVKVLDFGLSVTGDKATGTSGTLAYMAPESLRNEPAGIAADLYAAGVIAYELFVGRHPFNVDNLNELVNQILNQKPDLSPSSLNDDIRAILARLLDKRPDNRYQNAHDVINALSNAIGQPPPAETEAIRESYLQAAKMVGRETELTQLSETLEQALGGKGDAWLVGGESGVGKSRLLDELRIRAMVKGMLVLRGQAVSDGGNPYLMWQDTLRCLALLTNPNSIEASILKAVVPDISTLLGRPIADPPHLDPAAGKTRLITTVIDILQRQPNPIALILEDLQWASVEGLDLLRSMLRLVHEMPMLIVTSYRDDEARSLPEKLVEMKRLKLERLDPDDISELTVSMLGEAGKQPHIVSMLQRETEGNVFFLVEVMRVLAEEAGQIDRITEMTLPANIFAGGIQQLVLRRLNRIAPDNRWLLQLAAVAGRQLDLALLQAAGDKNNLDSWLVNCSDAAVIEWREERWRFAHDKLREGLLAELSSEQRQALHLRLAQTIERLYGDAQAATLSFHWGMAGNRTKEGHYAGIAGEDARKQGANHEAVAFLSKALELDEAIQVSPEQKDDRVRTFGRAVRERQIGQAYYGLGKLGESRVHLHRALDLLGRKLPTKGLIPALLLQAFRQFVHRRGVVTRVKGTGEDLLEAARIYGLIGEISYFTMEPMLGIYCVLHMANLTDKIAPTPELARANINMCIASSLVPLYRVAEYYGQRAEQIALDIENEAVLIQVLNIKAVYLTGTAQWAKADETFTRTQEIAERVGDRREAIMSRTTCAVLRHYQGRFTEGLPLNDYARQAASRTGNAQQEAWGIYTKAEHLMRLGRFDESIALFEEAIPHVIGDIRLVSLARIKAGMAMCYLRQGWLDNAQQYIAEVYDLVGKSTPSVYSCLELYSAMCDVYLTLSEYADHDAERQKYLDLAQQRFKFVKGMQEFIQ